MKLISSIVFIFKIFTIILILLTFGFMTRNVQRGFICGDPSLSLERHKDTVSNLMLVLWGAAPLLIFFICEILVERYKTDDYNLLLKVTWRNISYLSHRYLLDMLCMHIIIMSVKMFAAAHRPHFFETCRPDAAENCTLGTFVSEYKCTNEKSRRHDIHDASWSFFSGHAATCFYSCLFVVWYIHKRFSEKLLLTPLIQTFLICFAFYGSLSRVFDHRHHWWDVGTGIAFGSLTTVHAVLILCHSKCTPLIEVKDRKVNDSNESMKMKQSVIIDIS